MWGPWSWLNPAVLKCPRTGRSKICRPVRSRLLGSFSVGPHGPPDRCEHCLSYRTRSFGNRGYIGDTASNRICDPEVDWGIYSTYYKLKVGVGECSCCKTKVGALFNWKACGDGDSLNVNTRISNCSTFPLPMEFLSSLYHRPSFLKVPINF